MSTVLAIVVLVGPWHMLLSQKKTKVSYPELTFLKTRDMGSEFNAPLSKKEQGRQVNSPFRSKTSHTSKEGASHKYSYAYVHGCVRVSNEPPQT